MNVRVGDKVRLCSYFENFAPYELKYNAIYTVSEVWCDDILNQSYLFVRVEGFDDEYLSDIFNIDIVSLRKEKLNRINENFSL